MDIPDEIHKKLVCVARRGRFSHIIAPRVWQAPDGRVLQILDNQSSPLDETFYNAFVEFEKAELANESVEDAEEAKRRQDMPLTSSAVDEVVEVIDKFGSNVATATTSILGETENVSTAKPEQQSTITRSRASKVQAQSILAYMTSNKKAKTSSSSSMLSDNDTSTTLSKGDKDSKMKSVVVSSNPSDASLGFHPSVKEELESNKSDLKKVETVFTLRDCLIHQWDARIRARCYVLQPNAPKNAKPASAASHPATSNLEVIVWFRLGCVRLENNLAFAQALWLASKKAAKVHAIAFASEQHSQIVENGAPSYQAALSSMQVLLKREFGISLTVFDVDESAATSLLALWTRMRPVLGVFTTESYNATSMRVTQATSRAVQCPMFNFDSENPMPLRYLQASAKDVNINSLEAFKSHVDKHRSLPTLREIVSGFKEGIHANHRKHEVEQDQARKTDSSSSTPSTDSVHSSPDEQQLDSLKLPDIVEKRWRVRKLSLDGLSNNWSEKSALELASKKIDANDEQLVSHFRIGTLSPFSIAESRPELFFAQSWKSYRTFTEDTKSTL